MCASTSLGSAASAHIVQGRLLRIALPLTVASSRSATQCAHHAVAILVAAAASHSPGRQRGRDLHPFDPHFPQSSRLLWHRDTTARTRWHRWRGSRLHELLKLPTGCTRRRGAPALPPGRLKRCHPDVGRRAGACGRGTRGASFRWPRAAATRREEIVTFVVRGDCTPRGTSAAASGCACCGGGDTGFWSAPRIEAVRQATWRARARADCWIGAWRRPQPRGQRPSAAAGAGGEPTAAAAAAATVPGALPDVHACRARLIDPRCCGSRWSPTILSRALLTSSLHRARHAVIESLRRALAPHGGGGVRMRGSVTEYTR